MPSDTARRVVARFLQADHIGDLSELLLKYREKVSTFGRHEKNARSITQTYDAILKLFSKTPFPVAEIRDLRNTIPMGGDGSPDSISTALIQEYAGVQNAARLFCWASLQQVVLSPKVRKSIEAATKFWGKTPRLPKGGTVEKTLELRVRLYLDCIEDFQKYDKLFAIVVKDGKAHATEGEGATKHKAGPFTLVNTGGFAPDVMTAKAKLCEEVAHRMTSIGLGVVCYGEVLISNKLTAKAAVAAFYLPTKDEMFVRADAAASTDTVRIVCHELAHRFEHKFMKHRDRVQDLYSTLKGHGSVPKPKKGDTISPKGKTHVITDVKGNLVELLNDDGLQYWIPFDVYKGMMTPHGYHFVTAYAESGGPGENFAEMVSFMALGKLPKEQVELLRPLLG